MRSIHFKAMMAGLALVGWAAGINNGTAQFFHTSGPTFPSLITLTNTWHYNANATNFNANPALGGLGTGWMLPGYVEDPSLGWDVGGLGPTNGVGLFGFPNQTQLADWPPGFRTLFPNPLPNGVPSVPYIVTYYYRTHFNLPTNNPANIALVITNWIDDGVVYYLNGTELGRIRVAANLVGTNLNYKTLAMANTDQPVADVLIAEATNLLAGDNLIAAEVHQQSLASSDDAFGIQSMDAVVAQPLVITNQPQTQTAIIGHPVTFTVGGVGTFPFYWWYRIATNGASTNLVVSGSSNFTYTIASPQAASQGSYFVIVSNRVGKVTSSSAVLTVVPDTFGPLLLSATVNDTNNSLVTVNFNEAVNALSVTNVSNYTLNLLGTSTQVLVTNALAILSGNGGVKLFLASPLSVSNQYTLTVNNVRDKTLAANIIAPNSWIGISFSAVSNIFSMDQTWDFDQSETATLDPSWITLNYVEDPNIWGSGPGAFVFSFAALNFCVGGTGTGISVVQTTYFRTKFMLNTNFGPNPNLRFRHMIDDGAVFYLNGHDVYHYNMPAGTPTYDTLATYVLHAACASYATNIGPGILVKGANVLAVELHQSANPDPENDAVFGTELSISSPITSIVPADPPSTYVLHIQRPDPNDPNTVNLWWGNAHGFALEAANSPTGPRWIQVPNMATNMLISVTNSITGLGSSDTRFYRLHKVD
jgi:hypothetical protein